MFRVFEFNCFRVHCNVFVDHYPAEPRTHDYPGYPEHWELTGVTVHKIVGEFYEVKRAERPDWFEWLDEMVAAAIENDWEMLE